MSAQSGPIADFPAYVLIRGTEELLVERAVAACLAAARDREPGAEVVRIRSDYSPGDLMLHVSPSLFGGTTVVVVEALDQASDELVADLERVLAGPPDAVLVVVHRGGNRARKLLSALEGAGARVVETPTVKSDADKSAFVTSEMRAAGRRISPDAVAALVAAVGKDLRELAAGCAQLAADTTGVVSVEQVETYYGGRVEASAFKVVQAALAGRAGDALTWLRHALANGVDPVPIVAALAGQLRQVGRVGAAGSASVTSVARDLKLADWQVRQARDVARGWTGEGLGRAIQAVAAADLEVKGGGRDPVYAVERAVLAICEAHGRSGFSGPS